MSSKHEISFGNARAMRPMPIREERCKHCGILDCVAYSRIAGQDLCKTCWVEVSIIHDKYMTELLAWKGNK
jgi:hypothetical protein